MAHEEMRMFGYICPKCGKAVLAARSVFALEASNVEVACDCGQDRMARIKDELPEQQAYRHTIAAKIRDGLARLAEVG